MPFRAPPGGPRPQPPTPQPPTVDDFGPPTMPEPPVDWGPPPTPWPPYPLPPVQGPQDYPGNNPEFYQDLTEEALSEDGYWGTELPAPPSWPDTTNPPLTDDYSAPPLPTPFPSGGPLNPTELGEIESTMDSYAPPGSVFYEDYPLVDFPKAPAPQTPPLPGNPIAGRGPASPQTPKLPNPFGGGR